MKRGATKQITKDRRHESRASSDEEGDGSIGMKKAAASVLEKRPMKGLPKRAMAAAVTQKAPAALPVTSATVKEDSTKAPAVPESPKATKPAGLVITSPTISKEPLSSAPSALFASAQPDKKIDTPIKTLFELGKHDVEGAGEEDEETMHSCKVSAYKLTSEDGKSQWKTQGVGFVRLKKHNTTSAQRIVMRNTSTGNLIMNFAIHPELTPAVTEKLVSFTGHDEGRPVAYKLRLKTPAEAAFLHKALDAAK